MTEEQNISNNGNNEAVNIIHNELNEVMCGYIREFLNKFDNFTNQMKIADLLLKSYEYRYDKIQGKFGNINDITSENYAHHKMFADKCAKLTELENKMNQVESKIEIMNTKLNKLIETHSNEVKDFIITEKEKTK